MGKLEDSVQKQKETILREGVMDDETIHHEFVSGMHGRKIDFDSIQTNSELYTLWIDTVALYIEENFSPLPTMIVGVAGGGNRFAISLASRLGNGVLGLMTDKLSPKSVGLNKVTAGFINSLKPDFVLVVEDVGTAGTTSATAVYAVLEAGAKNVIVLNTWQRSESLPKLEEIGAEWVSIIKEPMTNYSPEDCKSYGYCKQGFKFVPHD